MTDQKKNMVTRMVLGVAIVIAVGFGQSQHYKVKQLQAENKAIANAVFQMFCYLAERDGRFEESCYGDI